MGLLIRRALEIEVPKILAHKYICRYLKLSLTHNSSIEVTYMCIASV